LFLGKITGNRDRGTDGSHWQARRPIKRQGRRYTLKTDQKRTVRAWLDTRNNPLQVLSPQPATAAPRIVKIAKGTKTRRTLLMTK